MVPRNINNYNSAGTEFRDKRPRRPYGSTATVGHVGSKQNVGDLCYNTITRGWQSNGWKQLIQQRALKYGI